MKLLGFRLENIGPVQNASLITARPTQHYPLTLITGQQGSGKSFVIKSLALALSWISARIKNDRQNGVVIAENDLRLGSSYGEIEIRLLGPDQTTYALNIIRQPSNSGPSDRVELHEIPNLTQAYRNQVAENPESSIPLLAFYPSVRFAYEFMFQQRPPVSTPEQYEALDPNIPLVTDLRRVGEWFKEQEDIEQEQLSKLVRQQFPSPENLVAYPELVMIYQRIEQQRRLTAAPGLHAVRQALKLALPGYDNWRIERRPKVRMLVDKAGHTLDIHQLSLSEKNIFALTVDLCRRLTLCNPALLNPAEGEGVVVIDDIDQGIESSALENWLHVLPQIFPNLQIIASLQMPAPEKLLGRSQNYRMESLASLSHDYLHPPRALTYNPVQTTEQETSSAPPAEQLSSVWPLGPADQCSLIFNPNGSVTTINMAKIILPPIDRQTTATDMPETSSTPVRTQATPVVPPPVTDENQTSETPEPSRDKVLPPKSK